jgi:hypothetical protein
LRVVYIRLLTIKEAPLDRKLLKLPFKLENSPDWICPTCGKGILRIKRDSFFQDEVSNSRDAHSHEAWEPEWIQYVYTCLLICSNERCKEVVANTGTGSVDWEIAEDENGEQEQVYVDFFLPKHFEPHLQLFKVPNKCPDTVAKPLDESFKLFFSSPSAAANNVRIAIEELLSELKIKRFTISNGKRRFINLHQRIELLPPKYAQFKEMILAIKWLGNAGSHGHGEVTKDDVMDAYELTAHILEEIYESKVTKLKTLAKKVNQKKGPTK